MALSLKEIQAKLLEEQNRKDRVKTGQFSGDNSVYPFWDNPEGSTATVRFLPDGDSTNDYFWVERQMIKLPFRGVLGQADSKSCEVQVPCMNMWKSGTCPVTAEISPWWKDDSLVEMARKYYRKKSFIFQALVPQNPNTKETAPANPIRRLIINPSIFDLIKGILLRPDLEFSPTDSVNGRDFYLTKTQKGQFANYTSSSWSMKERALSQDEEAAIASNGLFNLSTFLPKKPDEAHLQAIMEMFQASVEEQLYDPDRWGNFYKPNGMRSQDANDNNNHQTSTVPNAKTYTAPVANTPRQVGSPTPAMPWGDENVEVAETVVTETKTTARKSSSPDEILAAIRARKPQ